ncbi:hypothetical protein GCM10012319_49920 [Comamonas sp. KCTC 72670]|nr:hypothetical protein GCM10012319_49920 [Comamonas sp. KCTC 72670]
MRRQRVQHHLRGQALFGHQPRAGVVLQLRSQGDELPEHIEEAVLTQGKCFHGRGLEPMPPGEVTGKNGEPHRVTGAEAPRAPERPVPDTSESRDTPRR